MAGELFKAKLRKAHDKQACAEHSYASRAVQKRSKDARSRLSQSNRSKQSSGFGLSQLSVTGSVDQRRAGRSVEIGWHLQSTNPNNPRPVGWEKKPAVSIWGWTDQIGSF